MGSPEAEPRPWPRRQARGSRKASPGCSGGKRDCEDEDPCVSPCLPGGCVNGADDDCHSPPDAADGPGVRHPVARPGRRRDR
jgi:hypothetical protein